MAKSKKINTKDKSLEALKAELTTKKDELFKAKLDLSKRKLTNTTSMALIRRDIARILTQMTIMKGGESK